MDSLQTYEELKAKKAFNETQAKTLSKIFSKLVTKNYLKKRLDILKSDIGKDMQITLGKLETKMYLTAISMTGVIIAAVKLLSSSYTCVQIHLLSHQ